MTDGLSDAERQALAKLQHLIAKKELNAEPLSEAEIEQIRHMIEVYKSFAVMGRFASAARNVVLWLGIMFASWYAFKDWLAGLAKGTGQ